MPMKQTRNRLVNYLSRGGERRAPLRALLAQICRELPETVIFGGMIRDFGLGYAREFSSDIDLVSMAPSREIAKLIDRFNPTRNKFGGYRFRAADRLFDIWSFQDTWAIREGFVSGNSIGDLCGTTFFTLDAAVFHLSKRKLITLPEYENGISHRILGVNLVEHPFPQKMAQRAIHMAIKKDLLLSPELCEFVMRHSSFSRPIWVYNRFVQKLAKHMRLTPELSFCYKDPQDQLSMWCGDEYCHNYLADSQSFVCLSEGFVHEKAKYLRKDVPPNLVEWPVFSS